MKSFKKKLSPAGTIILGFLCVIILGTFFLCLPISWASGQWGSFVDSLFTSTSAVCVTGLTIADTAVAFSTFGQVVIMLLIQIGGLGFVTLTSLIFLLIGKKISYKNRITIQESLNQEHAQGVVKLVKKIIISVFVIEFVGFVMLAPTMISKYGFGDGVFKALFLSISSFCNAGFDNLGVVGLEFSNLAVFSQNVLVLLPVMLLIVVGGIGFVVLFDVGAKFGKQKTKMSFHSKLVLYITLVLVFGGAILFAIMEWNNPQTIGNMGFFDKIVNSFFMSISPRTAGFSTFSMASLMPASKVLTDILMVIGASPASTGGGLKTTTIFVLLLFALKRQNSKGDITFRKKQITNKIIQKCIKVVVLYLFAMIFSVFVICLAEGGNVSFESVIFEVISALSTVGLSLGITPYLGIASKLVLIVAMFVGRVGALTLTVALGGKQINEDIEYPDAKIIVG